MLVIWSKYIPLKKKNEKSQHRADNPYLITLFWRGLVAFKDKNCPVITWDYDGKDKKDYNINADTVASHMAVKLKAEKLTILTNVDGIIINGKLQSHVDFNKANKEIASGRINTGMIPKIKSCIYAVKNKCPKAHLINGLTPHSLLLEIFTDKGIGTEIVYKNGK